MNFKILSAIQIVVTALLMIGSPHVLFSQEVDSVRVIQPGLFVGLSLGPAQSQIINDGILAVSDLRSDKQTTFGVSTEVGYFFSKHFGISSGIGFVSYNAQVTLDTYQSKFNTVDSENETYERQVSGSGIKEVQKVGYLCVPVCLDLRLPLGKAIGFCVQAGMNLAVPVSKKYTSSGTFTYKGYYPAYNVLLENLPAYGFPSNISSVSAGALKIKPLGFNAIASAGFDFIVQKKITLALAVNYSRSLSNISGYSSPEKFQLSPDVNQVNSMMGGSSKASVQSLGVNVTLRYFLKAPF